VKKKSNIIVVAIIVVLAIVLGFLLLRKDKDEKLTLTAHPLTSNDLSYVLDDEGTPEYIDGNFSDVKVTDEASAILALEDIKDLLNIQDDVDDVLYLKNQIESDNVIYYELQQKYAGIDVLGAEITLSVDKEGKVLALNGSFDPGVSASTYGLMDENQIKEVINNIYGADTQYASIEKYIYNGEQDYAVYVVDIYCSTGAIEVIVNAKTGDIISEETLIDNEKYVYTGKGLNDQTHTINLNSTLFGAYEFHDPERNIIIADGTGIGNENTQLFLLGYAIGMTMPMGAAIIDDKLVAHGTTGIPNDLLTQNAVTAMNQYARIYDYYKNVLNRNSYDNKGGQIKVTVMVTSPFGKPYNNASWMKIFNEMFIGYNGDISYVTCFDVLAHEFTHGVINHTANFKSYKTDGTEPNYSGALNEAYADILGSLIEGDNWLMGEDLGEDKVIRNLTDPNSLGEPKEVDGEYYYPTAYLKGRTMEEFLAANDFDDIYSYDDGGVHHNSNVVSHTAYLMYEKGAFASKEEMAKVWYNSLFLLSSYSDFEDCAYAVIRSAANMGLSSEKISKIKDAFYETKMLADNFYDLSGTVTDDNGKAVEGVSVVAVHEKNAYVNFEVYTEANGNYKFTDIPEGNYVLVFDKAKYLPGETTAALTSDKNDININLEKIKETASEKSQIVFVMDISASMDTSDPTDVRKRIMVNILSSLPNENDVALVTFAKTASVVNNGLSNKAVNKKILMTDVFNIANDSGYSENAGTNGKAGIKKALSLFNSEDKTRKYIVFLTDGQDNVYEDDTTYSELIEKANKKNVRILTVGLGEDLDESNLTNIASETKGKYYYADSSSDLYQFDYKIFAELE